MHARKITVHEFRRDSSQSGCFTWALLNGNTRLAFQESQNMAMKNQPSKNLCQYPAADLSSNFHIFVLSTSSHGIGLQAHLASHLCNNVHDFFCSN
jgi:hypothetical protein